MDFRVDPTVELQHVLLPAGAPVLVLWLLAHLSISTATTATSTTTTNKDNNSNSCKDSSFY
jgi:hypothetical protein